MDPTSFLLTVVLVLLLVFVVITVVRAVRIVPQASSLIVERLGRYSRTLEAGLHILVPFFDRVRARVDLREQVVTFPPQPVITSDNLVVSIDTVIYFQPTDPRAATYEIANYIQGIEQLTVTTLRNVIGSLDLEQTLTSRDQINGQLRGVLDEATGRWGIRVNRVELKAIDPPASVQDSMEQQMRAERNRRAAILTAEGSKQSQILTAEGEKQSAVLRAEGAAQAAILKAQGEARAIQQVFDAIHRGEPDPGLLAYMYLQTLPKLAEGQGNTTWVIPAELTEALRGIGSALGGRDGAPDSGWAAQVRPKRERPLAEPGTPADDVFGDARLQDPAEALRAAREEAAGATREAERSTPDAGAGRAASQQAPARVAEHPAQQQPAQQPPAAPRPPADEQR
ncbi:SPFH domain-containing protein [Quadrisphaera sp. INWT6]|uniref:SPFH domain-containing protein n=1 Tax=Quadrisphaera sp. INWT6 TaxID=2596917 RepID=UPI0018928118|nr:SPFH domain-containing protein [Quadrisphaera sp. INWT6]MBF5083471.1 SPFH/Band 7/PHB domain protein [Quadrisphaera sp. INWT6]